MNILINGAMLRLIRNIMQLMLSPAHGWEDLNYVESGSASFKDFLVPLFALAGAAQMCQALYHSEADMLFVCLNGVIVFVSLFAGWQIAAICFKHSIGKTIPEQSASKVDNVVSYGMALMAIGYALPPLLPVGLGLSVILPLCAVLIVWKSTEYMQIPASSEGMYVLLIILSMYLPTLVIQQLTQLVM